MSIFTRFVYHFESMLTNLREFKALKSLEFTRLSPMLCYPTLALESRKDIVSRHAYALS